MPYVNARPRRPNARPVAAGAGGPRRDILRDDHEQESEARARPRNPVAILANLIGAMPEPAVIVGGDGRLAAADDPAHVLLPALKIGEPLVLALRAPDVLDGLRRVMASGKPETVLWSERVPVERLFDVCVAPLAAETGEIGAALLTLRDLTEARRVERMRVDFIANASHELRTPFASMLGFVDTLRGRRATTPRRGRSSSASCASRDAGGAAGRRPPVAVAHRAEPARAPRGADRSCADRAARRRHPGAARPGNGRRPQGRREPAGGGRGRSRRIGAGRRKPDRKRHQIRGGGGQFGRPTTSK